MRVVVGDGAEVVVQPSSLTSLVLAAAIGVVCSIQGWYFGGVVEDVVVGVLWVGHIVRGLRGGDQWLWGHRSMWVDELVKRGAE